MAKTFRTFFNHECLLEQIQFKADKAFVEKLGATKATKDDIEDVKATIDAVYQRIVHLSILQTEMAKSMVPQKSSSSFKAIETINTKIQQRDFLARQSQISTNWIMHAPLKESVQGADGGTKGSPTRDRPRPDHLGKKALEHFKQMYQERTNSVKVDLDMAAANQSDFDLDRKDSALLLQSGRQAS